MLRLDCIRSIYDRLEDCLVVTIMGAVAAELLEHQRAHPDSMAGRGQPAATAHEICVAAAIAALNAARVQISRGTGGGPCDGADLRGP